MMSAEQYLVVAKIGAPHGIKGWLKVQSYTEPADNILHYDKIFIQQAGQWRALENATLAQQGKGFVIKLAHCDDRTQAETYKHCVLAVDKDSLLSLPDNEYYWHQLQGLSVFGTDGQLLGSVSHLLETGANDVLVVKACQGSIDQRERLIPYRPEFVQHIDLANSAIAVDWPIDF